MRRVEIVSGLEKGATGTVMIGPSINEDDVMVNLDSVYGRINSRFNRIMSFNEVTLRDITKGCTHEDV